MSAGPHFTRIDIYTKGKDLFCPKAQNPKSKRCSGSMSGAALWDRLPKPSLGLVPPGKRAWGLGGMGRACQSQWIVTWRISTRPRPHVTCVTPDGRRGHLPALEPQFAAQSTGQQFAPHVPPPQSHSTLGAGTPSSALLLEQPTLGEMVAGKAGSSSGSGFSCPC